MFMVVEMGMVALIANVHTYYLISWPPLLALHPAEKSIPNAVCRWYNFLQDINTDGQYGGHGVILT